MKRFTKQLGLLVFLILGVVLASCQGVELKNSSSEETSNSPTDVKVFNSKEELLLYLNEAQDESQNPLSSFYRGSGFQTLGTGEFIEEAAVASSDSAKLGDEGTLSYSGTNLQEASVDEADIVKTDGEYIYTLSQNRLMIAKAYPSEDAKLLSETKIPGSAQELFLHKGKLYVLTQTYEEVEVVSTYDFVPRTQSKAATLVQVYNLEDKEAPEKIEEIFLSGAYYDARITNDVLYFLSREWQDYYYGEPTSLPVARVGSVEIEPQFLSILPYPGAFRNFISIASFNTETDELVEVKSILANGATTLYVSEENLYLASQKQIEYPSQSQVFLEAVLPKLPRDAQTEFTNTIEGQSLSEEAHLLRIQEFLESYYASLSKEDKKEITQDIELTLTQFYYNLEVERSKTEIQKFSLEQGVIELVAQGEVEGTLLNEFSLGEYEGNLRLATTKSIFVREEGFEQHNNVYVLDEELKLIGALENLAEDERIYSARFMEERLYLVTFKQVDPFFVIDLANPEEPEVLGYLKIPGFSEYLHPVGENLVLGLGKETKEGEFGGVQTTGLKVSLFDVSDVENPIERDKYVIEGQSTDSLALREHKAFLFDKEKELLVIPVSESLSKSTQLRYPYRYWQGAYVFTVSEEKIELRGKVQHEEESENYWYSSPSAVQRALYIEDVLYTLSEKKILMNNLEDLEELGEIDLNYIPEEHDIYPYYAEGRVVEVDEAVRE